jgi:hypothetical protein
VKNPILLVVVVGCFPGCIQRNTERLLESRLSVLSEQNFLDRRSPTDHEDEDNSSSRRIALYSVPFQRVTFTHLQFFTMK